ncbi:gfo/Idh/MocA family oxidoreductase, partial [Candidatus Bathyarchaeota archaeon]
MLIVGCGRQGEKHLRAYLGIRGVEPVVCEARKDRARELGALYSVRCVTDYDEALSNMAGELDAVDICTPTRYHYEQVMKALRAGLHVFCEKPLAPTYEQAKEIAEEAKKRDRMVMVGFLYKFHPAVRLVKNLLDSGALGEPYLSIMRIGGRGG